GIRAFHVTGVQTCALPISRMVLSSIRRDAEGRLILGSLGCGDGRPMSYIRYWADRIQRHYFPQLSKVDWQYTWTGRIAFTPEHKIGRASCRERGQMSWVAG